MAKSITFDVKTREQFFVDGDENRVIELDINDVNIVNRLSDAIPKMKELDKRWNALMEKSEQLNESGEELSEDTLSDTVAFADEFKAIEKEIRAFLDEAFDSPGMADTILGSSSAFSPVNGKFKYEQIIDVLSTLYEDKLTAEIKKFNRDKVRSKTQRYIKK